MHYNSRDVIRAVAACPKCGAQPGQPCTYRDAKKMKRGQNHHERQKVSHEIGRAEARKQDSLWAIE